VRGNCCHLGRDHAAHRVADDDGVLEFQRVGDIPMMQREIEHVAQLGAFLAVAIAGHQRRIDVIFFRERVREWILAGDAARCVQEEQRLARAALEVAHGHVGVFRLF